MGWSSDAKLFYGFVIDNEDFELFDKLDDLHNEYDGEIEIGQFNHIEYPYYYVGICHCIAWGGVAAEVNISELSEVEKQYDLQIKAFCEKYNVIYEKPKWFIATYIC